MASKRSCWCHNSFETSVPLRCYKAFFLKAACVGDILNICASDISWQTHENLLKTSRRSMVRSICDPFYNLLLHFWWTSHDVFFYPKVVFILMKIYEHHDIVFINPLSNALCNFCFPVLLFSGIASQKSDLRSHMCTFHSYVQDCLKRFSPQY